MADFISDAEIAELISDPKHLPEAWAPTALRGAPVSPYMAGKELGHGGGELVQRVYGDLGTIGQRSELVEYRPEQYLEELGEQIADLRAGM